MRRASFYRNVKNYSLLKEHQLRGKGVLAEYCIIHSIMLNKDEFKEFCKDFLMSYDFLVPYFDKALIERNIWKCVAVVNDRETILVVMNNYHYARFVAII